MKKFARTVVWRLKGPLGPKMKIGKLKSRERRANSTFKKTKKGVKRLHRTYTWDKVSLCPQKGHWSLIACVKRWIREFVGSIQCAILHWRSPARFCTGFFFYHAIPNLRKRRSVWQDCGPLPRCWGRQGRKKSFYPLLVEGFTVFTGKGKKAAKIDWF